MNRGSNVRSAFALLIMVVLFVVFPFEKLAAKTVNVTTLAVSSYGNADGIGTAVQFASPAGVAVDAADNVFVADAGNHRIRIISPALSSSAPSTFSAQAPATSGVVGTAYASYTFVADGSPTPTYSVASGTLPVGLTLNPTTGVLSGTPSIAGAYLFTVQAINSAGSVNSNAITITVTNSGQTMVSTFAGDGITGPPYIVDGIGTTARFSYPSAITSDASGNVYVSDQTNLRKITPAGVVTTLVPIGTFARVEGLTTDAAGNIYVSDKNKHSIYKVTSAGVVSLIAGSNIAFGAGAGYVDATGSAARFNYPVGIAIDGFGNLFVSDGDNHRIRKITPAGVVTTFAGSGAAANLDGTGLTAQFGSPYGMVIDASGNLYVSGGHQIRKITPAGVVTTLAGSGTYGSVDGFGASAQFQFPHIGGIDASGNLYLMDGVRVRTVTPAGYVGTIAGNGNTGYVDGPAATAQFNVSYGVVLDPSGDVYVCDNSNHRIRKIIGIVVPQGNPNTPPSVFSAQTPATSGVVGTAFASYTFVANGSPTPTYSVASGSLPTGLTLSSAGVLSGTPTVAGTYTFTVQASNSAGMAASMVITVVITPVSLPANSPVSTIAGNGTLGYVDGPALSAQFSQPYAVATDGSGNVYVADASAHAIRKITPAGVVSTIAGNGAPGYQDGTGTSAQFNVPTGVVVDASGNLYIADSGNDRIRKISPSGVVTTLAGSTRGHTDGVGSAAQFNYPYGIAIDGSGNLYIAEYGGSYIRKVTPSGSVTTLAGNGTSGYADGTGSSALFGSPAGLTVDASGTTVYVADYWNNTVRKINISSGVVTTVVPRGTFSLPIGISVDVSGMVYVADQGNHRIAKISPLGDVTIISGNGNGYQDGELSEGRFSYPIGIALEANTHLYVVDIGNYRIRKVVLPTVVAPTAFTAQAPSVSGVVGTAFASYTFVANGSPAPTYSVASGSLPTGLTLTSAGVLSGTPTVAGSYTFTVQASNIAGNVNSAFITITVSQAPSVFTAQTPATSGVVGTAFASYTFVANGSPAPTYSVASGSLPTGLTLSSAGVLSGTPTAAGSYTFAIQASNSAGSVNSSLITITVSQAPSVFTAQTPATSGVVGTAFASYTFVANGSPTPTYSVASGSLPTGLTLSSAGVLSGTPTAAGSYTFAIQASNSAGSVNSASVTITVTQPTTTISSFSPASATIGNTVTIRGAGFTGASVVRFGGTAAMSFVVASDTVITARVGTGASGAVSVTTPLGTASLAGFLYNVPPAPVAGSFSPTSARPGDTVVIRGVNFLSTSTVSFGGVSMRYTVVSDSVIHAYISASAVSGAVNVITQGGTSNLNGFTFIPLPPAPRITSFTPNRAAQGASVVITGTNLTGATRVKFGAFDAASFTVNSATQITAVVGAGSSGAVSVQTAGGTFSLNGFTFVPPSATLSGFMPTSAAIGQTVVITGTNLSSALVVEFGGRSAVFTVNSDSQITATVPSGAASGNISITTLAGAASIAGFTFLAPPVVSSFSPTSAGVGASVVIAGSNFSGADTVRIGGVVSAFVVNSASQITATVPSGAASGSVSVRTPYGTGSLAGFVFVPSPAITSFSPAVAGAGDVVTINGTNFTGASAVSFGGVPAASFTVVSATRITAAPAAAGASGDISVTTPNGTGARSGFSFAGVPVITAFSPTGATGGDTVTISGTGFVGVSTLTFGNTAVTSFTIVSPTEIKAVVSPRGSTGAVRLVTPGGTASLNGFTFTAPLPVITGFSPASATVEQTVTITGRNFAGDLYSTLAVSFGGRAAGRFTVVNDSTITAAVGGGATGSVSVRTPGGTANRAGFTFIPAAPIITGFTPASAPAGATITISGNNFFAASAVRFGGIAGTSLVVVNDSTVTVRVAASGATGAVTLTTPSGTATSASAFTFIPAPVISAFAPASASVGDTVSIAGTGFTGATAVRFGGTAALRFTVVSDTEIQAVVNGGSTGAITVVSPNGTGTLSGFTYLPPAPRITSFTPATAAAGTSVVINGNYFTGATAVNFGGIAAQSFVINSATRITAVVAAGSASGAVTVTSPNGTGTLAGFTFLVAPPAIASFSPTSAPAGGTVLIRGTGFTGATAVRFGGIAAASFTRTGDTLISARVAASGASGDVSVVSVAGTGTLSGFVFIPAPSISSFTPTSAAQGDTVTIAGANFLGTTTVSFGGAAANIVSVNSTQIVVLVGSGASGSLSLTTPGGSASKTGFTYLPPRPRITGFTPATATPGTSVVISGSSFTGATAVSFGGIAAASFTVNSATRITAVVPVGGLSGDVSVTTPLGTASMAGFTFTPVPAPVITSFTPTTMPSGSTTTTMTINGRNFTGATAVSVGGVAVPFTIVSATRITARLTGAIGGAVSVTTPGGTATMAGFVLTSLFEMKSDNLTSANGTNNAEELNVVAGVSNLDAPPLTAFPNPASESVTLTGSGFAEGRLVSVTLINTLGQTVLTLTQQPIGGNLQANVDVRQVPSGAYTAVLSDGVVQRAVRFVKR